MGLADAPMRLARAEGEYPDVAVAAAPSWRSAGSRVPHRGVPEDTGHRHRPGNARAIYDRANSEAMPALAALCSEKRLTDRKHPSPHDSTANYASGRRQCQALAALAADNNANEFGRKEALTVLAAWANPAPKDRFLYLWRPLRSDRRCRTAALAPAMPAILSTGTGTVQETAGSTLQSSAHARPTPFWRIARNARSGKASRIESLRALPR